MSWLCFLISSWNLLVSINAIHILSNNLILTRQALLLCLLLACQSATSASNVGTVLLSVVRFRAMAVAVESVLVRAANTHLTLTNMLRILIKAFVSIPLRLLRHSLLLTTQIHCLLLLRLARLSITFRKSGWLVTYVVLEEDTLFVGDCVLDGGLGFFRLVREG